MWVYQYQPLLNGLLQKALVELCTQSLPWEGRLEIDGIFCVSGKDPSQQIVIKIHKALEKPEPRTGQVNQRNVSDGNNKVLIEAGRIVSAKSGKSHVRANKHASPVRKAGPMPLNLSLPSMKSVASVVHNSTGAQPVMSSNSLPKSLTVSNQSLRALLGNKAAVATGDDPQPTTTILNQPQPVWLKRDDQDSLSEAGSDNRPDEEDLHIKEEAESESSLDLDEDILPATNVNCKLCSITFDSFQALQAHTQEKHKRHACRQCCNTFSLRCNLRRHERLHAGVKPHACSYCKKLFSRSADLKAHLRKHAAEQTPDLISCSKCPKSFRNAVNLRLHMYKVHKEKNCVYACSICEKVYHDADQFQAHRLSHTQSLVDAGGQDTPSECTTPVLNGSQDSMDGVSTHYSYNPDTDNAHSPHTETSKHIFADQLAIQAGLGPDLSYVDSPMSTSPTHSVGDQGQAEDMALYFGSPLVIKEENDSNDAEFLKRSSRRKSRPSKVVGGGLLREEEAENQEPLRQDTAAALKRQADGECLQEPSNTKRARVDTDALRREGLAAFENFGMADQSLEDIMKQVNENLYQNKDVLIAAEKEKEYEQKGKAKTKGKTTASKKVARMAVGGGVNVTSSDSSRQIEPKPPIVLLVSSNTGVNPKVAIPKMSLVKQEASTWSVSPKVRSKKDTTTSFSPIPHDLFLQASRDSDTKDFTCGQWGCNFTCVGFQLFEDHTLSVHGRYPCKFCSQTFTGRNNRTRHIRYHMTGKQHQCADCSKFFARPDSLKEHRFIHTKSYRDSNCCNCKIYFEKKATLLSHMKKCFSDDQLFTDKLSPEEIEREANSKKEHKDSKDSSLCKDTSLDTSCSTEVSLLTVIKQEVGSDTSKEQTAVHSTPDTGTDGARAPNTANLDRSPQAVPSDIGVMKAEYLQKEKQKILNVKTYLDTQMAAMGDENSLVDEDATSTDQNDTEAGGAQLIQEEPKTDQDHAKSALCGQKASNKPPTQDRAQDDLDPSDLGQDSQQLSAEFTESEKLNDRPDDKGLPSSNDDTDGAGKSTDDASGTGAGSPVNGTSTTD